MNLQSAFPMRPATLNSAGLSFLKSMQVPGSPFSRSTVGPVFDIDVSTAGGLTVLIAGTFTGQALFYEGSIDGSVWTAVNGMNVSSADSRNYPLVLSTTGSIQEFDVSRFLRFRARLGAIATGTMYLSAILTSDRPVISQGTYGGVADDGSLTGPPVIIGGRAQNAHSQVSANNDAAYLSMSLDRKVIVIPGAIPELSWQYAAAAGGIINTTPVIVKAAIASQRNYITSIQIRTGTLSADTEFTISDGSTVIYRTFLTSGQNIIIAEFPTPLRGTVNTALNAAILTASTGGVFINLQGYTGN